MEKFVSRLFLRRNLKIMTRTGRIKQILSSGMTGSFILKKLRWSRTVINYLIFEFSARGKNNIVEENSLDFP